MDRCHSLSLPLCLPRWRHPARCSSGAMVLLSGLLLSAAAQAGGVQVAELRGAIPTGRLVSVESAGAPVPWSSRLGVQEVAPSMGSSLYWLGDYRFAPSWGLRATGGLLGRREVATSIGLPFAMFRLDPIPVSADGLRATPYLGFGIDRNHSTNGGWGGWGLSADVGLVSRNWGPVTTMSADSRSVRLGNNATGDDWLRSLRLMPLVQVGVSYAF